MSRTTDALKFLRTFWGLLAAVAVTFPGAAALLKIPIAVENSRISILYPIVGVIVSTFALLLATAYRDRFFEIDTARRWAVMSMASALICFFAFVGVRTYLLDVKHTKEYLARDGEQVVRYMKDRGTINEETQMKEAGLSAVPNTASIRGDPWDILALALFTGIFASLSISFTALGLHVYVSENGRSA